MRKIEVVVGAQYGSEAKGHVTQRLVARAVDQDGQYDVDVVNVRVAGPNAGHTAYDNTGRSYALRQIPVGAVSERPVTLVIAPGSEIDLPVLADEIALLRQDGHLNNKQIYISPNATVITDGHKEMETSGRLFTSLVEKIGSTGKGIGAARADRIMRRADRVMDNEAFAEWAYDLPDDSVTVADYDYQVGDHVIIEGTQGYGLGLHGEHYPQCTSSDCRAIDFMAMAGISPWGEKVDVWAVARMFPIRVAGNSGYMLGETTWAELGLPEERTTVTKKVRRVGYWDMKLVRSAVRANGGGAHVRLALTMVDQKWPSLANTNSYDSVMLNTSRQYLDELSGFVGSVQSDTGAAVGMMTTGPRTGFFL